MITTHGTTIKLNKEYYGLCDRIPDFCRVVGPDRLLMLIKYGSHLYGTNTPDSDLDLKGVFVPSPEQILLNKIPKTYSYKSKKLEGEKNSSADVDIEIFSLHYFIELACKWETISIDILHAAQDQAIVWTAIWQELYDMRSSFYTKDMRAFVDYARTQAAKYGIKGSRLDAVKQVLDFLDARRCCDTELHPQKDNYKLAKFWNELPTGEHIHFLEPNPRDKNGNRIYQVCGKQFLESMPIQQAFLCMYNFYHEYGARAQLAKENKGIDWKAVSHAIRAAHQLAEIYETGDLKFPLYSREYLLAVKQGKHSWEDVQHVLEKRIEQVEKLASESQLPVHPDRVPIDSWLYETIYDSLPRYPYGT